MSPAIIPKLSALARTNVPKTTKMNVTSFVSRSVVFASASMASPPTSGIAEYVARLVSILCHASRLRSESTSTETAPIITAGAGPHSAIASTSAKNAPLIRSALCWSASRSLTIASASSTMTSPGGCQSSASDDATAATSVPRRITASATSSLLERAGMGNVSGMPTASLSPQDQRSPARRCAQIARSEFRERGEQLARGARAELEALEPVRLVGRVEGVVGKAEAGDDRRDRARGELRHDGDRAAAAHERRRRARRALERLCSQGERGQLRLEQRRVRAVPCELHLGALGRGVAQQPFEHRADLGGALAGGEAQR